MKIQKSVGAISDDKLMKELFEVEDFLILFSKNLLNSYSPEKSLQKAIEQFDGAIKKIFQKMLKNIFIEGFTFTDAVSQTAQSLRNPQSRQLFLYLMNYLSDDPENKAKRTLKLLYRIRENKQLYYKRKNMLKTQNFKIKLLINVVAIIFGFIAALTPWFSTLSIINNFSIENFNFTSGIANEPQFFVLTSFLLILIINSLILYSIVEIKNKVFYIAVTISIFFTTYLICSVFLTFNFSSSWV
ncbi:MAG: hypothetical protein ACTSVV_09210 [Promethearchaeota archaeon]